MLRVKQITQSKTSCDRPNDEMKQTQQTLLVHNVKHIALMREKSYNCFKTLCDASYMSTSTQTMIWKRIYTRSKLTLSPTFGYSTKTIGNHTPAWPLVILNCTR